MSRKDYRKTIAFLQNDVNSQKHQIDVLRGELATQQAKHAAELKATRAEHQTEIAAVHERHASLLADLLLLEPHLKHYQTESAWSLGGADWDRERIHRAANHLRGEQALESVGYTHHEPDFSNVTFVEFGAPNPEGAA